MYSAQRPLQRGDAYGNTYTYAPDGTTRTYGLNAEAVEETWVDLSSDGVFTRHNEVKVIEKATKSGGDLVCLCGNDPVGSGFYPCLYGGKIVEPTIDGPWEGKLYACGDCGRIIDQYTLEVVGKRDPMYIMDEAVEAGGWDD